MAFSLKPEVPEAEYENWVVGFVVVAAVLLFTFVALRELLLVAPFAFAPFMVGSIQQKKYESAYDGTLGWDPPSAIQIGRPKRVEVLVSGKDTDVAKLVAQFRGPEPAVTSTIPIRPALSVRLIEDSAFKVSEESTRDQYLEPGEVVRWYFEIDGKKSGRFPLRLMVSLRRQVRGKEVVRDLQPLEHRVRIRESLLVVIGRFVKKHKISAAIVTFGAWFLESAGLLDRAAVLVRSWFS